MSKFFLWLRKKIEATQTTQITEVKEKPLSYSEFAPFYRPSGQIKASVSKTFEDTSNAFLRPSRIESKEVGEAMDAKAEQCTMDSFSIKQGFSSSTQWVPEALVSWYGSQGFIGYQLAAIMAQHWLIDKACLMPAKDAVRNGYETTVNDGTEVSPEVLDAIRKADVRMGLNKNLIEFVHMGRIFGIRIAIFEVDSLDPKYYEKPFNPDGITPGSYKGIAQVDPYWITPELDREASSDPASKHFYEPTWWRVNTKRIHRSHLVIMRNGEVADILKPTYIYGGIPVPQKIFERVYNAERTANEAPMLAMTKRMNVLKIDSAEALANEPKFASRMEFMTAFMNNYGVKVIDSESEDMIQFDTSLTDLDAVIMTQYQIVAAAANVPAVKLLGTSPKGFNTTGEFEEANYHEELESIQEHDLTPFIERHHLLLIRSEIAPEFKIPPFTTTVEWNLLDVMTAKEQAEVNKFEAETGALLVTTGAIDGYDERQRIINNPSSGYTGLSDEPPIIDTLLDPEKEEDPERQSKPGVKSDPEDV